jgi:hypothetical protein
MINGFSCYCKKCDAATTHLMTHGKGEYIESKCAECKSTVKSGRVIDRLDGGIIAECPDCGKQTYQQRYITPANRTNLLCLFCGHDCDLDTKEVVQKGIQKGIQKGSGCFIATACYGSAEAHQVKALRSFRDRRLMPSPVGAALVGVYCRISPPVANMLRSRPWAQRLVKRLLIDPIVLLVRSSH